MSKKQPTNELVKFNVQKANVLVYNEKFTVHAIGSSKAYDFNGNNELQSVTSELLQNELYGNVSRIDTCIKLANIKAKALYLPTFKSFENYCQAFYKSSFKQIEKMARAGIMYTECKDIKGIFELPINAVNDLLAIYNKKCLPDFINWLKCEKDISSFANMTESKLTDLRKEYFSKTEESKKEEKVEKVDDTISSTEDEETEALEIKSATSAIVDGDYMYIVHDGKSYKVPLQDLDNNYIVVNA